MTKLARTKERLFWLMSAALLAFLAFPAVHGFLLNSIYPSALWSDFSRGLPQVFSFYAACALVAAVVSETKFLSYQSSVAWLSRIPGRLTNELIELIRIVWEEFSTARNATKVVLATLIATFIRMYFLHDPLRYDEAYTVNQYIEQSPLFVFHYSDPNNHVLYTLLAKLSTILLGMHEWSVRLPAFLAGILTVPAVFFVAQITFQSRGFLPAVLVAFWPYHVFFSVNGRGYTLATLLVTLLALLCHQRSPWTDNRILIFGFIAAAANFCVPTSIIPVLGIVLYVTLSQEAHRSFSTSLKTVAFPLLAYTVAFTAFLYSPVVAASNGFQSITANKFVASRPITTFSEQIVAHVQQSTAALFQDIPPILILLLSGLVVLTIFLDLRSSDRPSGTLRVIGLTACLLLVGLFSITMLRVIPYERTWLFLVPFFALWTHAWNRRLAQHRSLTVRFAWSIFSTTAMVVMALIYLLVQPISRYQETGYAPSSAECANYLLTNDIAWEQVVAGVPEGPPLHFYYHQNQPRTASATVSKVEPRYLVIDRLHHDPNLDHDAELVFTAGSAEIYRLAQ